MSGAGLQIGASLKGEADLLGVSETVALWNLRSKTALI